MFDNSAAPSDPNADFDDGPGNTPQADVSSCCNEQLIMYCVAPSQPGQLSHCLQGCAAQGCSDSLASLVLLLLLFMSVAQHLLDVGGAKFQCGTQGGAVAGSHLKAVPP